jgi:hypothetical protein
MGADGISVVQVHCKVPAEGSTEVHTEMITEMISRSLEGNQTPPSAIKQI